MSVNAWNNNSHFQFDAGSSCPQLQKPSNNWIYKSHQLHINWFTLWKENNFDEWLTVVKDLIKHNETEETSGYINILHYYLQSILFFLHKMFYFIAIINKWLSLILNIGLKNNSCLFKSYSEIWRLNKMVRQSFFSSFYYNISAPLVYVGSKGKCIQSLFAKKNRPISRWSVIEVKIPIFGTRWVVLLMHSSFKFH